MASERGTRKVERQGRREGSDIESWLAAISPENTDERRRTTAFKSLLSLAKRQPDRLLPYWKDLDKLLRSGRAFSKYPAVHILAALVPADHAGRFEKSFSAYFALLEDEAVSVAAHVAGLASEIAIARPALEPRITRRLLALDRAKVRPDRRDLIKAYALEAFDRYFDRSKSQRQMLRFAQGMRESSSPRAKKAAGQFLRKHGKE